MLKCFYILIWITAFKLCFCQRRMGLGNESVLGKKYLVYFVKSPYSNSNDDAWLCAGAIVTPTQILTAAACLVEINRIYAIAGYKKYVHARDIEKDKCAKTSKKKVVKISVPKEYTTSTNKELEWMNVDIGVATVQEPYDFNDKSYLTHCSYLPESITINYDRNNELEKTRAIALGWGGKKVKGAKELPEDTLKPKLLQEATTTIIEKTFCANLVPKNGSKEIVNKYLLCASGNGFLGEDGEETKLDPILKKQSANGSLFLNNATKNINQSNETSSRKSALVETCQNDHGGPLVSWVGNQEMVLGVALNGICNPNLDCVGPRIYVSTAVTAQIIKCLLETNDTRRKTCNEQMGDKRYQVNDIEIKWPEDLKNNSPSSLSIQQISSVRRQINEENSLNARPTKDLRTYNEQNIPKENQQDNPDETLQENPLKNQQENRNLHTYNEQQNPPQADQTQGKVNEELKIQPRKPHQRYMSQQQIESQNQAEIDTFNQPQMESQYQPQMEFQNQPEIDSFNQPQMESYIQPSLDPYYNQPPVDSYYNQPQMGSKNPPESESYNQPQTQLNNQPPLKPNNQKPYQPQMESFNQPHMANHPHRPINKDESKKSQRPMHNPPPTKPRQMESLIPSQVHLYNQPQIESFQQPQAESFNEGLTDQFKFSPFKKLPVKPFNKPQEESFNNSELGSPQSNVDYLSQYSYKEPQSSYSHSKTESLETKPTESYNPLDIIMAEDDVAVKRPMEEPYMSPHAALRNPPSVDSYMPKPIKPELDKTFEQPQSSHKYQPPSPHNDQPLGQPVELAPVQPFDPGHPLNALRTGPQNLASNPSQGDSQIFEQMFSQLHAEPEPSSASAPPPKEETFDELYRNLHDGRLEEPQDQEFEPRLEQPIEQEVEQTGPMVVNESPATESHNDVQVRHQVPLEYPDYSNRRTI